jgi:hypothetical protein
MGTRSLFVAAMFCTLILSASSFAAPIAYDESVSGDLPDAGTPLLNNFTLDLGTNTVTGTTSNTPTNEFDSFAFIVPAGMQVDVATVTRGDVSGHVQFVKWSLNQGSDNSGGGTNLGIMTTTTASPLSFSSAIPAITLPLSAGQYNITAGTSSIGTGTSSYTFNMHVVAVPEPTGLALLALAAGPLLGRRSRQA